LLLIRGSRFREEYKRFFYRDVQAIAVARAPRFHLSTRSGLVAAILAILSPALFFGSLITGSGPLALAIAGLGVALVAVWIYISAAESCRCRIYTAVSSDDLPSVYRAWTARKFVSEVELLIARTQGTIEGDWAAAAETRAVGPASASAVALEEGAPVSSKPPRRVLASDLFLISLVTDALARLVPLPGALGTWLPFAMELLTVAAAVAVIVQYNRGHLRSGMHRVAVASLLAFGTLFYVQSFTVGITASLTAAKTGKRTTAMAYTPSRLTQEVGAGFDAILLIVGLLVSLRQDAERRSGLLG
jgi:hypothetical protein